jgi:UDP-N-acetylmuramoylalanine--D-glutamate ligase
LLSSLSDIRSLRVTVMGLGLHGGGLASSLFFASQGAVVTVTDLRDAATLQPALNRIRAFEAEQRGSAGGRGGQARVEPLRVVLGEHHRRDFTDTDLVIKNPAVSPDSRFLEAARGRGIPIETDISVFLRLAGNPLLAVSGSKGKSTTASALYHCLRQSYPDARLGGNITVSPLSFLAALEPEDPVVLELSSWQLADMRDKKLLKPRVSVMTTILPDHQDKYSDMAAYVADKKLLFRDQEADSFALFNASDGTQDSFADETAAQARYYADRRLPADREGAFLRGQNGVIRTPGGERRLFGPRLRLAGKHNRMNLLAAGLAAAVFGLDHDSIRGSLESFTGIEHRLELFSEQGNLRIYNDSAATIPQATREALRSLEEPIVLITGGTDKNLDFGDLTEAYRRAAAIVLLEGSATTKIRQLLEEGKIPYSGPYDQLEKAVREALRLAPPGASIVFSPGCASFGMFLNEFDRGRKFKDTVRSLLADI